jgi:hypothetical protein
MNGEDIGVVGEYINSLRERVTGEEVSGFAKRHYNLMFSRVWVLLTDGKCTCVNVFLYQFYDTV